MIDLQNINTLAGIGASVVIILGGIGGWIWTITRQFKAALAQRDDEIEKLRLTVMADSARDAAAQAVLARDLNEHKLYAAEHFATEDGVAKALEPVLRAIERLGDRLDKIFADNSNNGRGPRA